MQKKPVLTPANAKKKQEKPVYIPKPFLRGKIWDSLSTKSALGIFGSFFLVMIAFLLLGLMMLIENSLIRITLNAALLVGAYLVFYSFGMGSGTQAVNQGEILQNRVDRGEELRKGEQDCCYHPMKGFAIAFAALLPFILIAAVLACIATRQMTSFGALPDWVNNLGNHAEINNAVSFYNVTNGMSLEDILRIFVRICVMPWVNIFNSSNMDNMLLLERLSPLLICIPALCYGLGYTRGPRNRARVHGDIAQGKRKAAKKAKRDHKRRVAAREPQRLN